MNGILSGLRRYDVLILVLVGLLSLGSTWMLYDLNKELTTSQELFDDNLPSYSVKAEYELARLVSSLNEFIVGTASEGDIQLRFDILIARLNHYVSAFTSENIINFNDEIQVRVDRLLGVMLEHEEAFFAMQPGDIAEATVIKDTFQDMYQTLEELTTLTRESHNQRLKALDTGLAHSVKVVFALIGATLLFGTLTVALFWKNLKEKTQFSSDLEMQIQARTNDLQISNTYLKQEIIERQRAEKTLAEREHQIHRVQKMEAVGRVTSGVAHDFNNLLAVIMGNIELVKGCDDKSLRLKYLENALSATIMGSQLTRKLLAFGRRSPLKLETVDINQVILEIDDLFIHTLPEKIGLDIRLADDIWPISVDRSLLENVLLNLVINARDAFHDSGSIVVETSNISVQQDHSRVGTVAKLAGDHVSVSITDNGTGMSVQVLDQVFEPFYSTKPETEGSGLGLSMASGFVQQSNGSIDVTSAPGEGTCVQLLFPRCYTELENKGREDAFPLKSAGNKRKILVVEDSEAVRLVVVEQLHTLGYETIEVANGDEAFAYIQKDDSIDLMLSDVVMPGELQGLELAERVRQLCPLVEIIVMSGYPKGTEHNEGDSARRFTTLMKPVSLTELSRALREEFENKRDTLREAESVS